MDHPVFCASFTWLPVFAARNDAEELVGEDAAAVEVVGCEVRTNLIPGLDATALDGGVGNCCWWPTTEAVEVDSSTAPCFFSALCFRYSDLLGQIFFSRAVSLNV